MCVRVSRHREGCGPFGVCSASWTSGQTKVFLKDGCMEKIHQKFRDYNAVTLQSWFRCRRIVKRYGSCEDYLCNTPNAMCTSCAAGIGDTGGL